MEGFVEKALQLMKTSAGFSTAEGLLEKQMPFGEIAESGLKRVNPDFQWSDFQVEDLTVTEWEEGGETYQGMRHKTTGLPHGIVKLLNRSTSGGNISEATFIDGKKFGYHRLVVIEANIL